MEKNNTEFAVIAQQYKKKRGTANAFSWVLIALAVLCVVGMLVCLVLLAVGRGSFALVGGLCAAAFAGIVLFGGGGFLLFRLGERFSRVGQDYTERAQGENCFLLGEGTFGYFEEKQLRIVGRAHDRVRTILVPYEKMRFFSVCSRRAPREKGTWMVVLEIPSHYLAKKGRAVSDEPALIQADGKPRLYDCLQERGIVLLGELPGQEGGDGKKFKRIRRFVLPDPVRTRKAIGMIAGGVLLFAGGIVGAVLLRDVLSWGTALGAVISVIGLWMAARGVSNLVQKRAQLIIYREGLFWLDRTLEDRNFLKWEEITQLSVSERDGKEYLRVQCIYGAYFFPLIREAFDYITAQKYGQADV